MQIFQAFVAMSKLINPNERANNIKEMINCILRAGWVGYVDMSEHKQGIFENNFLAVLRI